MDELTNATSKVGIKDAYGNKVYKQQDYIGSKLISADPSAGENPDQPFVANSWYCDTCNGPVSEADASLPIHMGHDVRYSGIELAGDVESVAKAGGSYKISFEADGVKPNESY